MRMRIATSLNGRPSLILVGVLSFMVSPAGADSFDEIAAFAEKICSQSISGGERSTVITANVNGDVSGLAKALGISASAAGLIRHDGSHYEGIPKDRLPLTIPTPAQCKLELVKVLIEERQNLSPPSERTPVISKIDLGISRAFVEQPSILGLPQYKEGRADREELDAESELLAEQMDRDSDMERAVKAKRYAHPQDYVEDHFEFATYRRSEVNYIIRYEKKSQVISGILLEATDSTSAACPDANLRDYAPLQRIFQDAKSLCLGKATFNDFFGNPGTTLQGSYRNSGMGQCWGHMYIGGASGQGSEIVIQCQNRFVTTASALRYRVGVGAAGGEIAHEDFTFDERGDGNGSLADFLAKVGKVKVDYLVFIDE